MIGGAAMFASIAQTSSSNSWTDGGTSFLGVDVEDDKQLVHGDVDLDGDHLVTKLLLLMLLKQLVHGDVDLDGDH